MPKRWALETSRRELSEDVSFGIGTISVVEQSTLENRPGGVIYPVVYRMDLQRTEVHPFFFHAPQIVRGTTLRTYSTQTQSAIDDRERLRTGVHGLEVSAHAATK